MNITSNKIRRKPRSGNERRESGQDRRVESRRLSQERRTDTRESSDDRRAADRRSSEDRRDRTTFSSEASRKKKTSEPDNKFGSFLKAFEASHSSSDNKTDEPSPEQERRDRIEETGRVLHTHSDFTNGKDEITSRKDYEKIATGERNEDFEKHLKEQHPDWSSDRISKEVDSLQENSQRLLDDPDIFTHYDTAKDGGGKDGKISDGDLVAGRLKNDIDKDLPPDLSVEEINELHEKNPGLGNQAITNKYYHQSQELNELLGGDDKNFLASWPAYGSLASNSAGAVIRSDGIPGDDRISDMVAEGNRKVFEDIAPHYDSYIEAAKEPDFNYKEWAKGEGFTEQDKFLAESFDFMDKARTTKDADKKQEYLLASNVLAGRHEQGRLEPEIDGSTAPLTGTGIERGVLELLVDKDPTFFLPNGKGHGELDKLDVSKKIEAPPADGLREIRDPGVVDALWRSLGQEGDPPASLSGQELIDKTGTEDWSNLDGRMRTIAGLMIAGQQDPRLGEYVLDYDQPEGLRTRDHIFDLAKGVLENAPLPGFDLSIF
jgi:hypothetical protein